ncbi:MAG: hypothetical protein KC535_01220 [Nanoarchaeota archaeon]|nr:hypothetical protein [Nanoarchaeota archaeon]
MQKSFFFVLILLLASSFLAGCTVREELRFGAELRDKNPGFTVGTFPVACIVTHPELVKTLNISLVDQNDQEFSLITEDVSTITELTFQDISGGTYVSTCTVCDNHICRSSESGKVLVSIANESIENYEFDLPPTFILGTPIDGTYFLSENPLLVSFSCLANDDVGLTAVSLVSNVSGLFSETFIQTPSKSSHLLVKDLVLKPGRYLWTCRATDTRAQTVVAPVRRFTIGPATPEILPNIEGFDGDTTDFARLDRLTDVPDVVIENTQFGKITFVDNISSLVGVDLSKGIIITQNSITVNSSLYPQLNVPAKLSFYDIDYDPAIEDASVEKDGSTYSVHDLSYDDGTLTFTVGNFSTYKVVITPQGGYNLEETPTEPEPETTTPPTQTSPEPDPQTTDPVEEEVTLNVTEGETGAFVSDESTNATVDGSGQDSQTSGTSSTGTTNNGQSAFKDDTNKSEELIPEDGTVRASSVNPLVLGGLIIAFIAVILLVVWLIKKRSEKMFLKRY